MVWENKQKDNNSLENMSYSVFDIKPQSKVQQTIFFKSSDTKRTQCYWNSKKCVNKKRFFLIKITRF